MDFLPKVVLESGFDVVRREIDRPVRMPSKVVVPGLEIVQNRAEIVEFELGILGLGSRRSDVDVEKGEHDE